MSQITSLFCLISETQNDLMEEIDMEQRIDYIRTNREVVKLMRQLEEYKKSTGIDMKLIELIKIRAPSNQWLCILLGYAHKGCPGKW
jgi:hypothetical protein